MDRAGKEERKLPIPQKEICEYIKEKYDRTVSGRSIKYVMILCGLKPLLATNDINFKLLSVNSFEVIVGALKYFKILDENKNYNYLIDTLAENKVKGTIIRVLDLKNYIKQEYNRSVSNDQVRYVKILCGLITNQTIKDINFTKLSIGCFEDIVGALKHFKLLEEDKDYNYLIKVINDHKRYIKS